MRAMTSLRTAAPPWLTFAVGVAAVAIVFAVDLMAPTSYWPALLYVLVIVGVSWVRNPNLVITVSILSIVGIATVGLLNTDAVFEVVRANHVAGRSTVGVIIAVIAALRIIRGAPAVGGTPFVPTNASEVAQRVSESAAKHAAQGAAFAGLEPTTRDAFKDAANDYAEHLETRLERILEVLPIVVWSADAEGNVDYFNEVFAKFTGRATAELVGQGWVSLIHPDDLEAAIARWVEAMTTHQPYACDFRMRAADGEYRWMQNSALPERDETGTVVRWWGTSVDVHDARTLEAELRETAADVEHVIQSVGDGVSELNHDWALTFVSERSAQLVGSTVEELLGKNVWELYPEMIGSVMEIAYKDAVATGEPRDFTLFNPVIGKWFAVNATPTDRGLTVAFRDVTDIKRLEANLERTQRLESVGRLTGGIAHDFNNLLTVILGGAEALTDIEDLSHEDRELLGLILEAARQGAELTGTMLSFAKQMPLESRPTDLNGLVDTISPLLRHALAEGIELAVTPGADLPAVQVDPTQFQSAVLNLTINASDAMARGGKLSVSTRLATVDEDNREHIHDLEPGSYVVTSVSDTGAGISAEHIPHLFDPFFTTKSAARGSGLGLAMVWGFAKQSGGTVTVYSEEAEGTTFNIYLPATDAEAVTLSPADAAEDFFGSGTILLAEDDALVRAFAAEQLRSRGYDVVEAASGRAALEALEEMEIPDLLFTDVVMPGGMNGRDLARAAVERRPGLRVLYASGYTEDIVLRGAAAGAHVSVLPKPYTARQLSAAVAHAIAREET